jgi:hypothetical protein
MLRRSMMLAAIGSLVGACARTVPAFTAKLPPNAPPPTKIERLLLWLPADDSAVNAQQLAEAFRTKLAPYGVSMSVGRARPLELERSDEQQPFMSSFKPTHRLEVDVRKGASTAYATGVIPMTVAGRFTLDLILYAGNSREPLRVFEYGPAYVDTGKYVDRIIDTLRANGYL